MFVACGIARSAFTLPAFKTFWLEFVIEVASIASSTMPYSAVWGNNCNWPKADELDDAIGRQLSEVHRTCCQRSRKGRTLSGEVALVFGCSELMKY